VLVPFCAGFTWQLAAMAADATYKPDTPYYFVWGGLGYLIIHLLFKKPILAYVVGHEMTHALFAMLFGGKVTSLHASNRGGRVTITRSNFLITLAPYFFPLYTFLALLLYGVAHAAHAQGIALDILVFVSGATFAFHVMLTLVFLGTDQTDIREHGQIFSYPLIYLFNIVFAAFLLHVYFAENSDFLSYCINGIMKSSDMLLRALHYLYIFSQKGLQLLI